VFYCIFHHTDYFLNARGGGGGGSSIKAEASVVIEKPPGLEEDVAPLPLLGY